MARLLPWLPLVLLLAGATAAAQPQSPVREQQQRQVVVPNTPHEPVPEARVAANVTTYLRFDAPIDRASVELEGRAERFHWVEVGERLVAVGPSGDLGAREKLVVRARYKDGASPAMAVLVLVTHPTLVDKEVEVMRRPRTREVLEGAGGPASLVFSGRIDSKGVQVRHIAHVPTTTERGLKVEGGLGFRAGSWALAVVRVRNLPGQKPWVPGSARLTRPDGTPMKVLSVEMDKAQLAPGEEGLVAVETEAPRWKAGQVFHLEVLDKSGVRPLPLIKVTL